MKNWLPLVSGPALAIARRPFLSNLRPLWNSSSKLKPGSPRAGAGGVAALDHEVGDDAVEDGAVVERGPLPLVVARVDPLLLARGQADEVGHRLRGVLAEELHHDGPLAGLERGPEVLAGLGLAHPLAAGRQRRGRRRWGRLGGGGRGRLPGGRGSVRGLLLAGGQGQGEQQGHGSTAGDSHSLSPRVEGGWRERAEVQRAPGSFFASESSIVNVLTCGGLLRLLLGAAPGAGEELGADGDLDLEGLGVVRALLADHPVPG